MSETRFHLRPGFRVLLIAGFCGAFTTFSSFIFEISGLIESGHSVKALGYLLMSVTVGFLFFRLGISLTQSGLLLLIRRHFLLLRLWLIPSSPLLKILLKKRL
jgi:hypothetical protein